jgi:hypothetical protein
MLDIGKTNLFLSENGGSIISRIIDDYDLIGHNCLFLSRGDYSIQTKSSTIKYNHYYEIPNLLLNNLFRVDIIIVEMNYDYNSVISRIREITEIPVILVTEFHSMKFLIAQEKLDKDFDYIYRFYREEITPFRFTFNLDKMEQMFLENSYINDIKNDWDMSFLDLRTQYIRDKKINDLLK